ncbi:hypothetical protein ACS0TY_029662 [Phlomoides rotata]
MEELMSLFKEYGDKMIGDLQNDCDSKDGSKSFTKDRLNDNFCDCADGTDEPENAESWAPNQKQDAKD